MTYFVRIRVCEVFSIVGCLVLTVYVHACLLCHFVFWNVSVSL